MKNAGEIWEIRLGGTGRHTKRKRAFYGCSNYPNCDFVSWNEPVNEKCPQCGEILFKKNGKKATIYCTKEGCGYEKSQES